jgi:hypothetical protein
MRLAMLMSPPFAGRSHLVRRHPRHLPRGQACPDGNEIGAATGCLAQNALSRWPARVRNAVFAGTLDPSSDPPIGQ